ncbi:MAG: hypothetical protein LQ337_001730 [Flavoplaca oasis]|nr:MAG: hypothetical protein LQ337_001730 [Flavoplaca oasis]
MSIDIDWPGLTTGPEGVALAESIRDFIHDKFQSVQLPRFIRSVEVHSFEFGDKAPVVELKDLGDPLPEFYEDDDSDGQEGDDDDGDGVTEGGAESRTSNTEPRPSTRRDDRTDFAIPTHPSVCRPPPIDTSRFGSRSTTPGIPGGTSNLSYFHLPLSSTGLSGTSTPLAAVAGGNTTWGGADMHTFQPFAYLRQHSPVRQPRSPMGGYGDDDPNSRPSTADKPYPGYTSPAQPSSPTFPAKHTLKLKRQEQDPAPTDLQIVLHISYSGPVRLSMTAEILLDYPMPAFVGIPLNLNITGLSFDGLAIIAYLRQKAHFCFLSEEHARTVVGARSASEGKESHDGEGGGDHESVMDPKEKDTGEGTGGLLREIRVESEIGRQEGGKVTLRNVGKVEKFVLEQVRRIFEEEFVWPSFWTFLV